MRSFFSRLHRRFGRRRTGSELLRLADLHRQRFEASLPLGTLTPSRRTGVSPGSVLVLGAGFAGCAAAYTLCNANFQVTLVDPSGYGGRVSSVTSIVSNRFIERGAELIGLNHPTWLRFANQFGLGLSVITSDDMASAMGLSLPIQLGGQTYTDSNSLMLYEEMSNVMSQWVADAVSTLPGTMPWAPWNVGDAAALDAQSLASQIPEDTEPSAAAAILLSFYLDNTVDPQQQSWLANLAQISAGTLSTSSDPLGFFSDTEAFRCESGNQILAITLVNNCLGNLRPVLGASVTSLATDGTTVTASILGRTFTYDYAIIAVPVTALSQLQINGLPVAATQSGPAVKYFAPTSERFWLPQGIAPLGFSDQIGMAWEGTDNQIGAGPVELSVFAGGQIAAAAREASDVDAFFQDGLAQLFQSGFYMNTQFVDWPGMPFINTGYSCPSLGQVTSIQQTYASPVHGNIYIAGEHASPPWFGFMEGALQSGVLAAQKIIQQVAG